MKWIKKEELMNWAINIWTVQSPLSEISSAGEGSYGYIGHEEMPEVDDACRFLEAVGSMKTSMSCLAFTSKDNLYVFWTIAHFVVSPDKEISILAHMFFSYIKAIMRNNIGREWWMFYLYDQFKWRQRELFPILLR